jgi:hypothetical protein
MATQETPNTEKTQSWEDFFTNLIKNPLTTFGGGLLGGYLLGTHIANQKIEKIEAQHTQQMQKRDEQFTKLIEQMSVANSRQEQFIKAFAAYSGQEIQELEEDPVDGTYKNRSKYKYGKKYIKV